MIRKPQVAGQFYPAGADALKKQLKQLIDDRQNKVEAIGLVCPHAGYVFSGNIAGLCFSQVKLTNTVIILGPNHTGQGMPFSIMTEGAWKTPLGTVEIDLSLAQKILHQSKYLEKDTLAHLYEHSIEVQLPFLQFFLTDIKIVPIVLSDADFATYHEIGTSIARVLKEIGQKSLIIASSDMTHYQPGPVAQTQDKLAIEAILNLDGEELLRRVREFNITMCGYGPTACMLSAANYLQAKSAQLIKYQTSGDISADYSSVVGYAGIMVI